MTEFEKKQLTKDLRLAAEGLVKFIDTCQYQCKEAEDKKAFESAQYYYGQYLGCAHALQKFARYLARYDIDITQ